MKKHICYTIVAVCSLGMFSCTHSHSEETHNHESEIATKNSIHDSEEIIFTPAQAAAAGVQVETAEAADFMEALKVGGRLTGVPGDEVTLTAPSNGIVSLARSSLVEGTSVRKEEGLLVLSGKKMLNGDAAAKTRTEYETAKKAYERAEELAGERIVSAKDLEEIRLRYLTAKENYEGVSARMAADGIRVASPMDGYLKELLVAQGEYVEAGQPVATLTKSRRLQLRAEVPQRYYTHLKKVTSACFKPSYADTLYNLQELNGRLLSYGKTTEGGSLYVPVTFEMDNADNLLSGSYVEVYLLSVPRSNVISIPMKAVIEEQGVYFVFLQLDEEGYKKQEISLGMNNGERVEVKNGLRTGDRVVTRGAYQIKLASASSVIPEGHTH